MTTLRDFILRLADLNSYADQRVHDLAVAIFDEYGGAYLKEPLTEPFARKFLEELTMSFRARMNRISSDELYSSSYHGFRDFFHKAGELTSELGYDFGEDLLNPPLTPTDHLVSRNLVGLGDRGEVIPKISFDED